MENADLNALPWKAPTRMYPMFGNWSCTWANDDPAGQNFNSPAVQIIFTTSLSPISNPSGNTENISGRAVVVRMETGDQDKTACAAWITHRKFGPTRTWFELVEIKVYADVLPDQQCQMARKLAAKAIPRLPAP